MSKKMITIASIMLVLILAVEVTFAFGSPKSIEEDKIRFNREVLGGLVGELVTEIAGTIIIAKLTLDAPSKDEFGIGNWLTFSSLYYLSSVLIFMPLGSAVGVSISGKLNGYESNWTEILKGSYDGVGYGLGILPILLATCPYHSAKAFEKNARKTGSLLGTFEGKILLRTNENQ